MNDLRDLTRLPVDEGYWKGLEEKIMAELGPRVREAAGGRRGWWAPLAAHAVGLGGLALAASLAALILLPRADVQKAGPLRLLGVPDNDPVLAAFVSASAPPPLTSLVLPAARRPQ
ncbi:MAG: hypothetical protein ACREON_10680 [Gemmatimonadaceae bacterium]